MSEIISSAPIMPLEEFVKIKESIEGSLVITSGGFDPIHPGHISCIMEAKSYGDVLGVVVNGDSFLRSKKGIPFMDLDTRCRVVSSIRGVDFVISYEVDNDQTVCGALLALCPKVFAKGGDRVDANSIPEWGVCEENGISIVTGVGDPKIHSSSNILEDWFYQRLKMLRPT